MSPLRSPLRVLHLGNLVNNAYYSAKFQRRLGLEADVLCYDDYWVMSSPEWEEADFEGVPEDLIVPDWWSLQLNGYQRPRWFVQGPYELCIAYLRARRERTENESEQSWEQLERVRRLIARRVSRRSATALGWLHRRLPARFRSRLRSTVGRLLAAGRGAPADPGFHRWYRDRCRELIDEFDRRFPNRKDRLTLEDLEPYERRVGHLKEILPHYDVVQAYTTNPLYPMLAGFRPYVAFEHGTLRDAPEAEWAYQGPFQDSPLARLTALGYALADHVFITNTDSLQSARRLGIESFDPLPHPLDENDFKPSPETAESLRLGRGGKLLFFCPIRHDWVDKGTDLYIRALPELRRTVGACFQVAFTPWGREIERSRRLIAELGCQDLVQWAGPFGRRRLARWLAETDVVFDQLAYPGLSGLTPRALACGTPVIASCRPEALSWMFSEPPPVLAAKSVAEIVAQTLRALEPDFRASYRSRARAWIERYHTAECLVQPMLKAYRRLLDDRPDGRPSPSR